jgi:hypothetical protein
MNDRSGKITAASADPKSPFQENEMMREWQKLAMACVTVAVLGVAGCGDAC